MPLFYQQDINEHTQLGVWHILEDEPFFLKAVPLHRSISHPHKRLQHLAGRYLLQYLQPGFPYELIRIADTRKPFLLNEAFHFSISHCADYAAVLISSRYRVGVDVELITPRIRKIQAKFLHTDEVHLLPRWEAELLNGQQDGRVEGLNHPAFFSVPEALRTDAVSTILWSAKESVFKWYGRGEVDFSDQIRLDQFSGKDPGTLEGRFLGLEKVDLRVDYRLLGALVLSWVWNDYSG